MSEHDSCELHDGQKSPGDQEVQDTQVLENQGEIQSEIPEGDQLNTGENVFPSDDTPELIDESKIQDAFVTLTTGKNFDFSVLNDSEHARMTERITNEIQARLITKDPLKAMIIGNILEVDKLKRSLVVMNASQDQGEHEVAILQKRHDGNLKQLRDRRGPIGKKKTHTHSPPCS